MLNMRQMANSKLVNITVSVNMPFSMAYDAISDKIDRTSAEFRLGTKYEMMCKFLGAKVKSGKVTYTYETWRRRARNEDGGNCW